MSQGSSKMGKSRRLYNSSARGWWEFLAIMTISMPQSLTSLLSAQTADSVGARKHHWREWGPRLGFWRLPLPPSVSSRVSGLSYLQAMEPWGAALLSNAASGPPPHQQLPLEGSRCVPPSTIWLPISQKTGWVEPDASPLLSRPNLVTNYPWALLFLFCFINL